MVRKGVFVLVTFLLFTSAAMAGGGFSDVGGEFWAKSNIEYLKDEGIISGYGDGTFAPNKEVKRSQVAKMLSEALDLELENRPDPGFTDINRDFTGYDYIAATAAEGIFGGKKDGSFSPNAIMTRAQMAAVLNRAFDLPERVTGNIAIADMEPGDTFYDDVQAVAKAKITTITSGESFEPYEKLTRAQFTAFLSRTLAPKQFIDDSDEDTDADDPATQTYHNEQFDYTVTYPEAWGEGSYFQNDPDERGKFLYDKEGGMIRVFAAPHVSDEYFPGNVEIKQLQLDDGKTAEYYVNHHPSIIEFSMVLVHQGVVYNISGETHPDFFNTHEEEIMDAMRSLETGGESEEAAAKAAADSALSAIGAEDWEALSSFVHPDKGVRFSPYAYVEIADDQQFTAAEMETLWGDSTTYLWGQYDGTGFPIELTFQEYYEEFIYARDYLHADETSVNERLGQGNTIDNSQDAYPDAEIVEYHFTHSGNGLDWSSLRLAMEKQNGSWYVVGVIHDQWTI
ncbi:S-layer homology domain-containing protein [Bacillus piscicola]|uniref:S-layer homology domain-containing protein n=1 Tax=Bacillus piscicola TaxID=1632684 RepID=UPI001F09DB42|nr:S-layer homology domain-containing protein [Bacillus piscicola]